MDFIRGISALLVLAGHLRAAMFVDFSELKNSTIIDKLFYFVTGLGHEAVMVFFVLSGFFVGGTIIKKKNSFQFLNYLIARLSRLWTVFIPALIFTFLIDQIIRFYFPQIIEGEHLLFLNSGPNDEYSTSIITFLSNVMFFQTIFTPVFGSNGPLWSLANEFWYYIFFPLLMICTGFIKRGKYIMFMCFMFLLFSFFIANSLLIGFIIWILGVGVFVVYSKNMISINKGFLIPSLILFLLSLIMSKFHFIGNNFSALNDVLIGICFSFLLISIREFEVSWGLNNYFNRFSIWLSEISFSLYIFHFPIVLLIYSIFYSKKQIILNPLSFIHFTFWFLLIVLISSGFWWLFERNTFIVRNFLSKFINLYTNSNSFKRKSKLKA